MLEREIIRARLEGFDIDGTEFYPYDNRDFTTQLMTLKSQNVDMVWGIGYPEDERLMLEDLKRLGWEVEFRFTEVVESAPMLWPPWRGIKLP